MLRSNQLSYITEGKDYSQTWLLPGARKLVCATAMKALAYRRFGGHRHRCTQICNIFIFFLILI